MRRAGFFASLLLVLCLVDARFLLKASGPTAVTTAAYSLGLEVTTSGAEQAGPHWSAELLLRKRSPAGRFLFYPRGSLKGGPNGKVVSRDFEEGDYWLITRAPGFARDARLVHLKADQVVRVSLVPARTLEVRVMAEKGDELIPFEGATILVGSRGELPVGAASGADGRATFDELPEGPVRVRIFAQGYESYEAETEGDLLVKLRPTSTLRVSVKDGGKLVPDAEVIVAGVTLWPTRTVLTGHQGRVNISGLKPGTYSLLARKGGRISKVHPSVEVLAEQGHSELVLELGPGHFVPLQVVSDDDEKPISGARVTWNSSGLGQFAHHERTAEDGSASVGPLVELGGTLMVRAPGFVAAIVPVLAQEERGDAPQLIRLVRAATVSGRVVDTEGFPVPGATVEAVGTAADGMPIAVSYRSEAIPDAHFDWASDFHNDPANVLIPIGELGVMLGPVPPIPLGEVRQGSGDLLTTDDKGRFTITGVPPGEVVVIARHPQHMDGKSEVLNLPAGGSAETEVVLGEGKPLRGRVLDHRGFPIPQARVQITARGFEHRLTAESDGTFRLGAAPEKVTLRISLPENPFRIIFSRDVEVSERDIEIQVELPEPREAASFLVLSEKQEPVELAQLTLISTRRDVPFKQTRFTQSEGRVEMPESRDLSVRLTVQAPGYVKWDRELRVRDDNRIELKRSVRASGRVLGVRGRLPAGSAEVVFQSGTFIKRTTTNEIGEYRLTGLPPGSGTLKASHPDYGKGSRAIAVKAIEFDREASLPDLVLRPTIELSGHVEDANGRPIEGAVLSTERLSPFLSASALGQTLGRSGEGGRFTVSVQHEEEVFLYGAELGRSFGWSDAVVIGERDRIEDVRVLLDHKDPAIVNERGTVLLGMEERDGELVVYAVAPSSQAALSGIRAEDVIREVDGEIPRDEEDARDLLSGLPGTDVRLVVRRFGQSLEMLVARELFAR